MSQPILDHESSIRPYSHWGKNALLLGVLVWGISILNFWISTYEYEWLENLENGALEAFTIFFYSKFGLALLGIFFGILGLFQKNQKHLLSWLGIILCLTGPFLIRAIEIFIVLIANSHREFQP